jgi:hypothetical protein
MSTIDDSAIPSGDVDSFWNWILDSDIIAGLPPMMTTGTESLLAEADLSGLQGNQFETNPVSLLPQYQFTPGVPSNKGLVIPTSLHQRIAYLPKVASAVERPSWLDAPSITDTAALFDSNA